MPRVFLRSPRFIEKGERIAQSAVCTSSPLRSLRPCPWNVASWRAGVGRVRTAAFLSTLRGSLSVTHPFNESNLGHLKTVFPQSASRIAPLQS